MTTFAVLAAAPAAWRGTFDERYRAEFARVVAIANSLR